MKSIFLTAAAFAFTALLAGEINNVEATGTKTSVNVRVSVNNKAHLGATIRINSNQIRVHVRNYGGWNRYCWFAQYGCYGLYCPAEHTWYYWYAPMQRFLPISYMALYPPTRLGVGPIGPVGPMGPIGPGAPGLPTPGMPTPAPPGGLPPGGTPVQTPPMTPPAAPPSTPVEQ